MRFSRINLQFAETHTPYLPDGGIIFICHNWGLLSADDVCQVVLRYQRITQLLNQVFLCHRIKSYDSGEAEIVIYSKASVPNLIS